MRRLIVTENMSFDGVVAPMDGWFDPAAQDAEVVAAINEQCRTVDAVVLGRTTFKEFAGFWPHQTDDPTGFTDYLNAVQKYVVSTSLEGTDWQNTTILRGPAADELAALKDAPGGDIDITGSVSLVHSLWPTGLIDLVRAWVFPAVQGYGRRLLPDGRSQRLELVGSRVFDCGVVLIEYRPV
ncbi:dihydrofolate reductase family protein [Jatrophihabitans sp.]|uniref:dihydrofolate reductase family protein n=1 Tax=Jatrophihabitans sp. TaxID=1932789 RepID=UPI002C174CFD|nr:dihydrofolate reductase family protein [Jatrophihabitans sp.]